VQVEISGRHVEVTGPMRSHIRQQVDKLPHFDERIQYLNVTLTMQSYTHTCEIIGKCHKADLVAEAKSHDMYQSIDEAFAKMARQMVRHHDKLVNSRSRAAQRASEEERRPE